MTIATAVRAVKSGCIHGLKTFCIVDVSSSLRSKTLCVWLVGVPQGSAGIYTTSSAAFYRKRLPHRHRADRGAAAADEAAAESQFRLRWGSGVPRRGASGTETHREVAFACSQARFLLGAGSVEQPRLSRRVVVCLKAPFINFSLGAHAHDARLKGHWWKPDN